MMKKSVSYFLILSILMLSVVSLNMYVVDAGGVNIALGKPVTFSSEYSDTYSADKINDGSYSTSWSSIGSAKTPKDGNWVIIDLGTEYNITQISAYSRSGGAEYERVGWVYSVANNADFSDGTVVGNKGKIAGNAGEASTIDLSDNSVCARYVKISYNGYMVVAELEVYGNPLPEKSLGDYDDVDRNSLLFDAVKVTSCFDIVDSESSNTMGLSLLVKRKEAAKMLAKLNNSGDCEATKTIFEDVPSEDAFSGYIKYCVDAGIVMPTKYFRPEEYITGYEFITMVLRVNNYIEYADYMGQYPDNIANLLNKFKLFKDVDLSLKDNINKEQALLILYDALISPALDIEMIENDRIEYAQSRSLLEKIYDCKYCEGIVTATEFVSLSLNDVVGSGMLKIGDTIYKDNTGVLYTLVGERIKYIADDEYNVINGWKDYFGYNNATIKSEDIVRSTSTFLEYYCNDRKKKLNYDIDVCFLKNGVKSNNVKLTDLKRTDGTLEFIDNNGDGKYDVIKMSEPQVIVIDTVNISDKVIALRGRNGEKFESNDYDHLVIMQNGSKFDASMMARDGLAYVYASEDKKYITIEYVSNIISGNITGISDNRIEIDGNDYEFSDYYKKNDNRMPMVYLGMNASFVLNSFDRLVWVMDEKPYSDDTHLGYIVDLDVGNGFHPAVFRIYSENSGLIDLSTSKKLMVDGGKISGDSIENKSYYIDKLVSYNLDANGDIRKLDTENYIAKQEPESSIMLNSKWKLTAGSLRGANGFYDKTTQKMELPVYENFGVMTIPVDESGNILSNTADMEYYSYNKINDLYKNNQKAEGIYKFYGKDEFDSPIIAVRKKVTKKVQKFNPCSDSKGMNNLIVERITKYLDDAGEEAYRINGYDLATGRKKSINLRETIECAVDSYKIYIERLKGNSIGEIKFDYFNFIDVSNSTGLESYLCDINELNEGDILRYDLDGGRVCALERVYNIGDETCTSYKGISMNTGDSYSSKYRAAYEGIQGIITRLDNSIIDIDVGDGYKETFNYMNTKINKVIIFDGDDFEVQSLKSFAGYADVGNKVYVVANGSVVYYMVIYK